MMIVHDTRMFAICYNGPLNRTASMRAGSDVAYSGLAQLVEQAAVNRRVVGSSPTAGAMFSRETILKRTGASNAGSFA